MKLQWFGIGFGSGIVFLILVIIGICYAYDNTPPSSRYDPIEHNR